MNFRNKFGSFLIFFGILYGCSGLEDSEKEKLRKMNETGEHVYRLHHEFLFNIPEPKKYVRGNYPWENTFIGDQIRITKEFFRCRGSSQNVPITKGPNEQPVYIFDCGGTEQHSLPFKDGKEFIYPVLIELLNYIQEKTKKKVIITCGYRCPTHNTYADPAAFNRTSKHMIGAEVDFYIKSFEWSPEVIVELLQKYYTEHPQFQEEKLFTEFKRFEKDTNVSTLPWYNKEIFIKLFKKDEGRDKDNDHRFPYISIQVKWDRDRDELVTYSWSKAFNSYLRY